MYLRRAPLRATVIKGCAGTLTKEVPMKFLIYGAFAAALIGVSGHSYAAENGINYDPSHSQAYIDGQKNHDGAAGVKQMTQAIEADLSQIKNKLGFNIIKTYYSWYCNIPTGQCVPSIPKLAHDAGLKVLLGVYEFPDHLDYTKTQVDAAIAAANAPKYGSAVIGIVVGNEDMFDSSGVPILAMQQRIVQDMKTIKAAVSVPVTTAQRQGDWCGGTAPGCDPGRTQSLNEDDPYHVLDNVDVIGANIFPYWGGSPEKINGVSVASNTQATAEDLATVLHKRVIVTEEGWPSCANSPPQHPATIEDEIDYFHTWSMHTDQKFDSYYFQGYDLASQSDCSNGAAGGDANLHFGLCTASGQTKDAKLIACDEASRRR
jgi:exo-beta-1,3-glucanase (GH17 family)